jgi:Ca2+-binding RTX toxin-like protein
MASLTLADGYQIRMTTIDFSGLYYGDEYHRGPKSYVIVSYADNGFVDFRGSGFKYNNDGVPISGSVNSYAVTIDGARALTVAGFHVAATDFVKAATTFSLRDDQLLLGKIFAGNDKIDGADGNDILLGFSGKDRLFGRDGNDKLDGMTGNDTLTGGRGTDTFVFHTGSGKDTIAEFADDKIDLSRLAAVHSFKDLTSHHLEQHGRNVWIDAGHGDVLIIKHVHAEDLDKGDFLF